MRNPERLVNIGICLFIAITTYIVYYKVVDYPFISLDTPAYVYENSRVTSGMSWENVRWAFTSAEVSNWHPVTWLSHLLDVEAFGLHAGAHHHTNLIFHIVNSILLYLFLVAATGHIWRCCLVSLLFALHPLHVESVAWVAERKDLLCGLFFFLTLLAYRAYVGGGGLKWYLATIGSFVFGLLSKPMIVTLPFLLLVLDYWPFRRYRGTARAIAGKTKRLNPPASFVVLEKLPLVLLSMGMSMLVVKIQQSSGALADVSVLSVSDRLANAAMAYMLYLRDTFWPLSLGVYYPLDNHLPGAAVTIATLGFVLITTLVICYRQRFAWALSGWLWFTGMLVPVIGIVHVGAQARADRYTYLPSIGIFIILAWLLAGLAARTRAGKNFSVALVLAVLLAMVPITVRQIGYWQGSETLYRRTLEVTGNNSVISYNLGLTLYSAKKFRAAITQFSTRLADMPTDARAHYMNGLSYVKIGATDRALFHFRQAVMLPDTPIDAYLKLAALYKQKGDLNAAIDVYQRAIDKNPADPRLHNNLGTGLVYRCELHRAKNHFEIALRQEPNSNRALNNLRLVEQIDSEIQKEMRVYANALSGPTVPQDAKQVLFRKIKQVFTKYRVPVSDQHIDKMISAQMENQ